MSNDEFADMCAKITGYWPSYKITPERIGVLDRLFAHRDYKMVLGVLHNWVIGHMNSRYPDFDEIIKAANRAAFEASPKAAWSWSDEHDLAMLRVWYLKRKLEPPVDNYLIQSRMHRDIPTHAEREAAKAKWAQVGKKNGASLTVEQTLNLQYQQAQARRRAEQAVMDADIPPEEIDIPPEDF